MNPIELIEVYVAFCLKHRYWALLVFCPIHFFVFGYLLLLMQSSLYKVSMEPSKKITESLLHMILVPLYAGTATAILLAGFIISAVATREVINNFLYLLYNFGVLLMIFILYSFRSRRNHV